MTRHVYACGVFDMVLRFSYIIYCVSISYVTVITAW